MTLLERNRAELGKGYFLTPYRTAELAKEERSPEKGKSLPGDNPAGKEG